ncbi:MAG: SufE family protein [Gemmatimonadetes bacterium]|nr:SufE family protein [Gemmatimonadota bacterium]MCC6773687.1 SufE family protein [Gemmatimonadaceae bacterium]
MTAPSPSIPPRLDSVLRRFRALGREEKMAALVSYARKLEPLPERYRDVADDAFSVPECQTPVRLFPEVREGTLHFHADIDVRQSPTVAAFLAIVLGAVNGEPPATTLAIPADFVRVVMQSLGLGTREVGLEAIVARLKRHARAAQSPDVPDA